MLDDIPDTAQFRAWRRSCANVEHAELPDDEFLVALLMGDRAKVHRPPAPAQPPRGARGKAAVRHPRERLGIEAARRGQGLLGRGLLDAPLEEWVHDPLQVGHQPLDPARCHPPEPCSRVPRGSGPAERGQDLGIVARGLDGN